MPLVVAGEVALLVKSQKSAGNASGLRIIRAFPCETTGEFHDGLEKRELGFSESQELYVLMQRLGWHVSVSRWKGN